MTEAKRNRPQSVLKAEGIFSLMCRLDRMAPSDMMDPVACRWSRCGKLEISIFFGPRGGQPSKPTQIPGLDESTCQAAIAAGIPVEHLREMGVILKQKPRRLDDLPRTEAAKKERGPLDESEGEEEEPELVPDGAASGGADGVEKAILQLTKIATKLTEPKEKKDWFDSIIRRSWSTEQSEKCGCDESIAEGFGGATQANLPEHRSEPSGRAVVPGEPFAAGATTRGWLTARSRVQNHTNQVRWSWQVCGIWDALIAGRAEEARARCAVLIAASDQSSIDNGSWLLASSALLEAPPPYQAFQHRSSSTRFFWSRVGSRS